MAAMTAAAVLALIASRSCLPPTLAPIAVGIALNENPTLDIGAVNHNKNGTTDWGLAQINSSNFGWLSASLHTPVNEKTITDPCLNLQAALRVLFARYNGNPPDNVKAAYADGAARSIASLDTAASPQHSNSAADGDPQPPYWDLEAIAEWRQRRFPSPEDAAASEETPAVVEPVYKELK